MKPHRRHVWMTVTFAAIGVLAALVAAVMLLTGLGGASAMPVTSEPTRMAAASPAAAATEPPPTPTALPTATAAPTLPPATPTPIGALSTPTALPQTGGGPESQPPTPPGAAPTQAPSATVEMPTPAPVEPPGPSSGETPAGSEVAMAHTFTLIDEAGNNLGSGQVNVYAPSQLAVGEAGEIRVEIRVTIALPTAAAAAEATATPSGGGAHPTPTLPALIDSQMIEVREYMGAGLRGLDLSHFRYEAVPANGLLHMRVNVPNVWRWNITPAGAEAVGINRLEVYIYLPQTRSDGTAFNEETNTIPLTITVPGEAAQKDGGGQLGILIAALVAVGGAGGAFAGAAQYVRARRAAGTPPPAGDDEPGKPFDVDVDGDVSGSLTVAGDDVITYQTIVQNAPTVLIVGLIIGLVALVAGLVVIVIVLVP